MARKYDLISELYRRTAHAVVSDVQNWQAFCAAPAGTIVCALTSSFSSTPKDRTQRQCWRSSAGTTNSGVG